MNLRIKISKGIHNNGKNYMFTLRVTRLVNHVV